MISHVAPDVLWVGLGTPKQEHWMHEHKNRLNVPVLVGVGAAFDMLSGRREGRRRDGCASMGWSGFSACSRSRAACGGDI